MEYIKKQFMIDMSGFIKGYQKFIIDRNINESDISTGSYAKSGKFSDLTKMMMVWCGFAPSKQDSEIYHLAEGTVNKVMDFSKRESVNENLFTSVSPTENGSKVIFQIIVTGKMMNGLLKGAERKIFKGRSANQLSELLEELRNSSEYKTEQKNEGNDSYSTYGYVLSLDQFIRILPIWANFMRRIGYAKESKSDSPDRGYFDEDFFSNLTKSLKGLKFERLEMIFPGNWDEYSYLQWVKEGLGMLSPVFDSIDSAGAYLRVFEGNKFKEVIIGSHGSRSKNYSDLIKTIKGGSGLSKVTELLKDLAKLLDPDSSVYFTSCTAGDNQERLIEVAKLLNCPVYGAEGTNYFGFASKKAKFWVAKPDGSFEYTGSAPPFVLAFENEFIPNLAKKLNWIELEKAGKEISKEWDNFKEKADQFVDKCSEKINDATKAAGDAVAGAYKTSKDFISSVWNNW